MGIKHIESKTIKKKKDEKFLPSWIIYTKEGLTRNNSIICQIIGFREKQRRGREEGGYVII